MLRPNHYCECLTQITKTPAHINLVWKNEPVWKIWTSLKEFKPVSKIEPPKNWTITYTLVWCIFSKGFEKFPRSNGLHLSQTIKINTNTHNKIKLIYLHARGPRGFWGARLEKDPKWHLIDWTILLTLPCTKKENLTCDQESLGAFFHVPLQLLQQEGRKDLSSLTQFLSRQGETGILGEWSSYLFTFLCLPWNHWEPPGGNPI